MVEHSIFTKLKNKLDSDSHLKEVLKGSITFFTFRLLGIALTYTFMLLVTRKLGASAWGVFTLSLTLLQITSVISRLGLDTALLRFIAQFNAQGKGRTSYIIYKKSLKLVIPFSIFLSIFVYYLSPFIAEKVFKKEHLTQYFQLASLGILPLTLLLINSESLRSLKKIKEYSLFQNALPFFIAILLLLVFFKRGAEEEDVLISYLCGILFAFLLSYAILKRELSRLSGEPEDIPMRSILYVSLPMFMSSSLFMIMSWTDTIMLGMFRTEEEVGIYNVAVRLSMITSFTLVAVNSIVAPKFAEFWGKGDIESLKKIAQQSTKLIFWTSAPILALYLLFPSLFMGLFGEEFKKGTLALVILTIGQFVNAACGSVGLLLSMTKYYNVGFIVMVLTTLLNIFANLYLIQLFGFIGASIASAMSIMFWNISLVLYVRYKFLFWLIQCKT